MIWFFCYPVGDKITCFREHRVRPLQFQRVLFYLLVNGLSRFITNFAQLFLVLVFLVKYVCFCFLKVKHPFGNKRCPHRSLK